MLGKYTGLLERKRDEGHDSGVDKWMYLETSEADVKVTMCGESGAGAILQVERGQVVGKNHAHA
jgi:hypothetical protein